MKPVIFIVCVLFLFSCSPIRTSSKEEKHQLELTLQEVQTNQDDLRHDINSFRSELQIMDGRIKHEEDAITDLKSNLYDKQENSLDVVVKRLHDLEQKFLAEQKAIESAIADIRKLSTHANETTSALCQYKDRLNELENRLLSNNKGFEEIAKLKGTLKALASGSDSFKVYRVKPGDSLEKIARTEKVNREEIKKLNNLEKDLIVVGQELKIPKNPS